MVIWYNPANPAIQQYHTVAVVRGSCGIKNCSIIIQYQVSYVTLLSYKRRGRRGPLPQHWSVLKQYGLGWKFKAGNVVKEEWDNSRSVN